jgi:hypothetical protein
MKALILLVASLFVAPALFAQYKAPSDYFRKDSPNRPGGPAQPGGAPAAPAAPGNTKPAAPAKPAFKDLPVNTQFYFLTDTNRVYAWTKVTDTTAKNDKKGLTRAIPAATLVQR